MPRIELSVTIDYLPKWGVKEGLRELCQNFLDAQDDTKREGAVYYRDGMLRLRNPGAVIGRDALLFGTTSKVGRVDQRGQFGEGLKIGTLALVRAGLEVRVETPDEIWTARIEESETFAGRRVLAFHTRARTKDLVEGVEVIVRGVSREDYEAMKGSFIHFLKPTKVSAVTEYGTVLRDPAFKGHVFAKGVLVTINDKLWFGYDMSRLEVDRDRRMTDTYSLSYSTCKILSDAKSGLTGQEALDLLEAGYNDLDAAEYQWTNAPGLAAAFLDKYGEDAVPVSSAADVAALSHVGERGVPVNIKLQRLLEKDIESAQKRIARLRRTPKRLYAAVELSPAEADNLAWAIQLVSGAAADMIGATPRSLGHRVRVVDFHSPLTRGLHRTPSEGGFLDIARSVLVDRVMTLRVLVHELAHDWGYDGEKQHIAAIEELWMTLTRGWLGIPAPAPTPAPGPSIEIGGHPIGHVTAFRLTEKGRDFVDASRHHIPSGEEVASFEDVKEFIEVMKNLGASAPDEETPF